MKNIRVLLFRAFFYILLLSGLIGIASLYIGTSRFQDFISQTGAVVLLLSFGVAFLAFLPTLLLFFSIIFSRKKRYLFPGFEEGLVYYFSLPFLLLVTAFGVYYYHNAELLTRPLPEQFTQSPPPNALEFPGETVITQPPPQQRWDCEKITDKTTACAHPADDRMSTVEELNSALNEFRKAHGLNPLEQNGTLCSIAQSRAEELNALGSLDEHEGFEKYAKGQTEFNSMGEVLYGGVQPQYGVHIVEWGWARSLTGHKEAMLEPKWQYGCGGISGYFAVYIFGRKP